MADLPTPRRPELGAVLPLGRLPNPRAGQEHATLANRELRSGGTTFRSISEALPEPERRTQPLDRSTNIRIHQNRNDRSWRG